MFCKSHTEDKFSRFSGCNHFQKLEKLGVIGSKSVQKRPTKENITNFFFSKVDGLPRKSIKRPNDEMRPERYVEAGLKGVSAEKMDANQGNFEAAVKSDSAKITSRKLTCSTVERWKTQDLVLYEAGSWLTYDSEKTKRGHHCAALKCTERYVVSLNL